MPMKQERAARSKHVIRAFLHRLHSRMVRASPKRQWPSTTSKCQKTTRSSRRVVAGGHGEPGFQVQESPVKQEMRAGFPPLR